LVCPVPANNGHRMRTWSLVRALSAEGHAVTFLGFARPEELAMPMSDLRRLCENVELVSMDDVSLSSTGNYLSRARALFSNTPYAIGRFNSEEMRNCIADRLRKDPFDAVVCDTVYSAVNLPESIRVPVVMNTHNVEHLILERYAANERNPFKRLYALREARVVRRWEQEVCNRATLAMACSEDDRQLFKQLCPDLPITVVPNIVDVDDYSAAGSPEGHTVLFQGGMDWFPNRDAVSYFLKSILPLLRRSVPEARFVVAGRNPSDAFLERYAAEPYVKFTGTVPDMREVIRSASVCVVPLRIGSGTRLKILEAGAMAKPIVSTTLGAEGLEFRRGREILIADRPEEFAAQVAELLQYPGRARRMGEAARALVEERYSFSVLRSAIRQTLSQIPESRPAMLAH
jgi:polysaccharide biosynthesis protein PslH